MWVPGSLAADLLCTFRGSRLPAFGTLGGSGPGLVIVHFSDKEGSFVDECFQNLTEEGKLGEFLVCSGCGDPPTSYF